MTENGHLPHHHGGNAEKLFDHMPAPAEFTGAAELFRLMSDGTRIRLFEKITMPRLLRPANGTGIPTDSGVFCGRISTIIHAFDQQTGPE